MKWRLSILIACWLPLMGCASHYKITLTNGNTVTTLNKPKLDRESGAYNFKDLHGRPASIPAFRIKEIEPLN